MLEGEMGIRILQNNLHKNRERTNGILKDPNTEKFTMLLLQEQFWSRFTKSSPIHHAWNLYEPTLIKADKQPQSAIYVNKKQLAYHS